MEPEKTLNSQNNPEQKEYWKDCHFRPEDIFIKP